MMCVMCVSVCVGVCVMASFGVLCIELNNFLMAAIKVLIKRLKSAKQRAEKPQRRLNPMQPRPARGEEAGEGEKELGKRLTRTAHTQTPNRD